MPHVDGIQVLVAASTRNTRTVGPKTRKIVIVRTSGFSQRTLQQAKRVYV
jgi:hypothetical protein